MSGLIARAAIPCGETDSRHQPSSADRNHQRVEIGDRLEHFERDRALPGHDLGIVERMDEDVALGRFHLARLGEGVVVHRAVEDHPRPMTLGLADLHRRGRRGHDDGDGDAEPLAMVGDRLGVVARRGGDDPAAALLLRKLDQLV